LYAATGGTDGASVHCNAALRAFWNGRIVCARLRRAPRAAIANRYSHFTSLLRPLLGGLEVAHGRGAFRLDLVDPAAQRQIGGVELIEAAQQV